MSLKRARLCRLLAYAAISLSVAARVHSDETTEAKPVLSQWAIVAIDEEEARTVADLLTAELSSQPDIRLVERDELNLALNELELAAIAGDNASQRLRLGQLLRADALVLLGIVEHNDQRFLKMTISDCRYGARLRADHFPIVEGKADEAVSQCTAAINATRESFPEGVQQMIGVPQFVSRNLTHDYDHLQAAYASLVAESLRAQPGVAVIEVDEAHEIRKELALAGDRLERRVVPLFVDGAYKVTVADPSSPPTVEIDVRLTDGAGVR